MTTMQDTPPKRAAVRKPKASAKGAAAVLAAAAAAPPPGAAGELPLELVDAEHFTNPRGPVDTESPTFVELLESVKAQGVLQPIVVGPALVETGKHPIVAGWRRYAVATAAGLPAIPVRQVALTDAQEVLVAGLAENVAREDMSPLAEARAIDTLMREHGYTQVAAGKAIGMAERTVRERLRLLKIDKAAPAVGAAIDRGSVPMDAAVQLQLVADASPDVAEQLLLLVERDDLVEETGEKLSLTKPDGLVDALEQLAHETRGRALIRVGGSRAHPGEALPLTQDQLARWSRVPGRYRPTDGPPAFTFNRDDIDAADRAGALLRVDYKTSWDYRDTATFLLGGAFLEALLEVELAAMEKAGHERLAAWEAERKSKAVTTGKSAAAGLTLDETQEAVKAKAKQEREVERAHQRNALLGERATLEVLASQSLTLPAAQLLALLVLDGDHHSLIARGIRICDAAHLTEKPRKNGNVKRTYSLERGTVDLRGQVLAATTPAEAIAPVLRAYALARAADERVVSQSNRAFFHLPGAGGYGDEATKRIPKALDAVLEASGILDGLDDEAKARASAPAVTPPAAAATADAPAAAVRGSRKRNASSAEASRKRNASALELITARPGITIPELADAMDIKQNYLYRILPDLQTAGKVRKLGRGWHAVDEAGGAS